MAIASQVEFTRVIAVLRGVGWEVTETRIDPTGLIITATFRPTTPPPPSPPPPR